MPLKRDASGRFLADPNKVREMELKLQAQIRMFDARLIKAVRDARAGSLRPVGFLISQLAKSKVKRSPTKSPPGRPPHTRRGRLKFAIRYSMAANKRSIVIGPAASKLGQAGSAHEHGGLYKSAHYPERPLMGPVLVEAQNMIGPAFARKFRSQFV